MGAAYLILIIGAAALVVYQFYTNRGMFELEGVNSNAAIATIFQTRMNIVVLPFAFLYYGVIIKVLDAKLDCIERDGDYHEGCNLEDL